MNKLYLLVNAHSKIEYANLLNIFHMQNYFCKNIYQQAI